ncbi:hypothetical protein [Flagellimonas iocasae]|uniref:Uncharacterized protein n=1 Tax=Flagellimonas iocasae TaxID=2055905 RepID=A0ABW4XVF1_9FLAO
MEVKLNAIFRQQPNMLQYDKQSLLALEIKEEFMLHLAEHLGMSFLENDEVGGNLCYAHDRNIRYGYRTSISKSDVLNYLDHQLVSRIYAIESDTVFFTQSMGL